MYKRFLDADNDPYNFYDYLNNGTIASNISTLEYLYRCFLLGIGLYVYIRINKKINTK